nr:MAG TPA_asm: hypothetical protein [Bacteriophage sp.]
MPVTTPSITQNGRLEPFDLQVGRGQITGHTLINVQGYNASQHTTFRAVWEKSDTTDYTYPAGSVTMAFTSSLAETLVMRVEGLDASYAPKTATVTFSGGTTGTVTTGTADFFRINAMQITQGSANDTIVATNGGVTYAQINPGLGRSQASIYTVPAGYTFFLTRAQAFTTNNGTQFCTYRVWSRVFVNGVSTPNIVLSAPFTQAYSSTRVVPRGYPEKTDIQWQLMQSNVAPGSVQLEGILIKNDGAL